MIFSKVFKQIYDLKCVQGLEELLCQDVALQYHHKTLYGSVWSGDDILIEVFFHIFHRRETRRLLFLTDSNTWSISNVIYFY